MKVKKVYDLTYPLYHNCLGLEGAPLPQVEVFQWQPRDLCTMEMVTFPTHVVTHADVPMHFIEGAKPLEEIPAETWIGEGVMVDVPGKEPNMPITYEDLDRWGAHVRPGDIMALRTGDAQYYGRNRRYMKDYPAINVSGAKWIVERGVKVVGCDTYGIENFGLPDSGARVHQTLLGAGVCIVEQINLEEIAPFGEKRWMFCWLPMLIKGAGGSLVRAVAMDVG